MQLLEKFPRGEEEEWAEAGAPRQRTSYARPTLPNLAPAAPLGGTSGAKGGGVRGVPRSGVAKTGTAKTATAGAAKKGGSKRG
jgi:hypothetical protein